jgi:hypothetical protein
MMAADRKAEILRVKRIIASTNSPYLRRDMAKYLKRLEKEERYGNAQKSR